MLHRMNFAIALANDAHLGYDPEFLRLHIKKYYYSVCVLVIFVLIPDLQARMVREEIEMEETVKMNGTISIFSATPLSPPAFSLP